MIYETLEVIVDQINKYLDVKTNESNVLVLGNIAKLNDLSNNNKIKDKIVASLLNLEEKGRLKNRSSDQFMNSKTIYKNRSIDLNFYVLFAANRDTYERSLISISNIIEFFQSKKIFTQMNRSYSSNMLFENIKEFKFIVDLYTPTFEQLNYIWGTLGGKSVPGVLYKVSILTTENHTIQDKMGKLINEITGIINGDKLDDF